MSKFDPTAYIESDGLLTPEIGLWGLQKYKLMGAYCDIFTSGMKNLWDQLVYIDLFSGAGQAKIKNENKYLKTSAMLAASVSNKFSKYIFCEADKQKIETLQARVTRDSSGINAVYIEGDSNKNTELVIREMPAGKKILQFCFVDPFSLNLEFETIKKIANAGRVDFLILLALQMDGKRNFHNYIQDESNKIDLFIGNTAWRAEFKNGLIRQQDFLKFLADSYDKNMKALGYIVDPHLKYRVKNHDANLPLYYLAFYSKHERGNDFYKKIETYQTLQLKMF